MRTRLFPTFAAVTAVLLLTGCTGTPAAPEPTPIPRPAVSTADIPRFVAFGDSGTRSQAQAQVARAMIAAGPYDAVIHTGDLIYPDGNPNLISDTLDIPYAALTGTAWIATAGNHDEETGHANEILAHLGAPTLPYRTQVGPAAFYVLDSFGDLPAQAQWLTDTAAHDLAPVKIAVTHAPALSCSKHGNDTDVTSAARILLPALDAAHVTLLLSGHDHVYERFGRGTGRTTQVVTGGGGADLYPLSACPHGTPDPTAADSAYHYLILTVTTTGIHLTAVTPSGRILDDVTIPAVGP